MQLILFEFTHKFVKCMLKLNKECERDSENKKGKPTRILSKYYQFKWLVNGSVVIGA